MVKTYGELYQDTRRVLLETENAQDAGVLARMLICHVSGKNHAQFLADRDLYAGETIVEGVEKGLKRLLAGEPIAYILGQWEFYGLPMLVSPKVLIPRDDTCAVAKLAIRQALFLDKDPRILDLCCGSGCIGLAVASRVKDAKVTLADVSLDALAVAKENTALNKLTGRVRCVQADALKPAFPFLGKFDLIVSNPPYITAGEMLELPVSVKDYEPHLALDGGEDALLREQIGRLLRFAPLPPLPGKAQKLRALGVEADGHQPRVVHIDVADLALLVEPAGLLHFRRLFRREQLRQHRHRPHEGNALVCKDDGPLALQHVDQPPDAPLQRGHPFRSKRAGQPVWVIRLLAMGMVRLVMDEKLPETPDSFGHSTLHSNPCDLNISR